MVDDEKWLPASIKRILEEYPEFGVCIVFRNSLYNFWYCLKLPNCEFARQRISNIVEHNQYSAFEKEYIIFDRYGNICHKNSDAEVFVDEFDIIHINGKEFLIKPFDNGRVQDYLFGKSITEILEKAINLSTMGKRRYYEKQLAKFKESADEGLKQKS